MLGRRLLVLSLALAGAGAAALLSRVDGPVRAQGGCTTNADCAATPDTPFCDTNAASPTYRQCVANLGPAPRQSASAQYALTGNPIGACLLHVVPNRESIGNRVNLDGRLFSVSGDVVFSGPNGAGATSTNVISWDGSSNPNRVTGAQVPVGAQTGYVWIDPDTRPKSNELSFFVDGGGGVQCYGTCSNDLDCTMGGGLGCSAAGACCTRPAIETATPTHGAPPPNVCLNQTVDLTFQLGLILDPALGNPINANLSLFQEDNAGSWVDVPANRAVAGQFFSISRNSCAYLTAGTRYRVVLKGGMNGSGFRAQNGVSMYCDGAWAFDGRGRCGLPADGPQVDLDDYVLEFRADPGGCLSVIDSVNVRPSPQRVNINQSAQFGMQALDNRGWGVCVNTVNWSLVGPVLSGLTAAPGPLPTLYNVSAGNGVGDQSLQASVPGPSGNVTGPGVLEVRAGPPGVVNNPICAATMSPSPRPEATEACRNTVVQAYFTIDMDVGTLGLTLRRCNTGGSYDPSACINGTSATLVTNARYVQRRPAGSGLQPDTWYRAYVPGTALSAVAEGHLGLAGLNFDSDGNGSPDAYEWHFKTRVSADACLTDRLDVVPSQHTFTNLAQQQLFEAYPISNQCAVLLPPPGASWLWTTADPLVAEMVGIVTQASSTVEPYPAASPGIQYTTVAARLTEGATVHTGTANLTVDTPYPLLVAQVLGGECRNGTIEVSFSTALNPASLNDNIHLQLDTDPGPGEAWQNVSSTWSTRSGGGYQTVTVTPAELLTADGRYRILVDGDNGVVEGVRGSRGQPLSDLFGFVTEYAFVLPPAAGDRDVCRISHVRVERNSSPVGEDTFMCAASNCADDDDPNPPASGAPGNQHVFQATALAANGDPIRSISYVWSTSGENAGRVGLAPLADVVAVTPASPPSNGDLMLYVDASSSNPSLDYGSARGSVAVRLFMCQNPWPAVGPTGIWGPYEDVDTGFSFFYCRDDGDTATTTDDLPALPASAAVRRSSAGDIFREFIFLPGSTGGEATSTNLEPYLDDIADQTVLESEEIRFYVIAHDPEGDALSFAPDPPFQPVAWGGCPTCPPYEFVNLGDRAVFSWIPDGTVASPSAPTTVTVRFRVRDSAGNVGETRLISFTVLDNPDAAPIPPAPTALTVQMGAGPSGNVGVLNWQPSPYATHYRVFRRDDGPAGGIDPWELDEMENNSSGARGPLRRALAALPHTVKGWARALLSPVQRLARVSIAYALAPAEQPIGAYGELPTDPSDPCYVNPVPSGSSWTATDSCPPPGRRLCYAIRACSATGCSSFSGPACAETEAMNVPPSVTIVYPPSGFTLVVLTGTTVGFRGTASDPDDSVSCHIWNFGDGSPEAGACLASYANPFQDDHAYTTPSPLGNPYIATLYAVDTRGATSTIESVAVDVRDDAPPIACFLDPAGPLPAECTVFGP